MHMHKNIFFKGMRDGIPIALGYLAVSFTLGIVATKAGITPGQAALTSFLVNASAGEYIGFTLISAGSSYWEMIVMEAVANARYLLMSCSLSQKLPPETPLYQRLLLGFDVTDELFGISISVPGKLDPFYTFGAMAVAIPGWAGGTLLGGVLGNVLPVRVLSALGVGLYGMFVAIFIPPAKRNKVIGALVIISFAASFAFTEIPLFSDISSGVKTIILTVLISLAAALLFPVKEEQAQ